MSQLFSDGIQKKRGNDPHSRLPLPRRFGDDAPRLHVVHSTCIVSQRSGSIAKILAWRESNRRKSEMPPAPCSLRFPRHAGRFHLTGRWGDHGEADRTSTGQGAENALPFQIHIQGTPSCNKKSDSHPSLRSLPCCSCWRCGAAARRQPAKQQRSAALLHKAAASRGASRRY